jgi:hypothetical protein
MTWLKNKDMILSRDFRLKQLSKNELSSFSVEPLLTGAWSSSDLRNLYNPSLLHHLCCTILGAKIALTRNNYGLFPDLAFILILLVYPKTEESKTMTTEKRLARVHDRPKGLNLGPFIVELDIQGVIIFITWLCLIFLALSHLPQSKLQAGRVGGTFLAIALLAILSLCLFFASESCLPPKICISGRLWGCWDTLKGCFVVLLPAICTLVWAFYYSSYLQVDNVQTSTAASHITNTHVYVFELSAPLIGLQVIPLSFGSVRLACAGILTGGRIVRRTGGYRHPAVYKESTLESSITLPLFFHGLEITVAALTLCQMVGGLSDRIRI